MGIDVYGHLIFDQEFGITDKIYFELTGKSGLYFVKINTRKGNKAMFRIVKESHRRLSNSI